MVGGGKLYSKLKGSAVVNCEDGSKMILHNVLYVPKLGINLMSSRQMCQSSRLKGTFDEQKMYFMKNNVPIITATMRNGLYIVTNVSANLTKTALETQGYCSKTVNMIDPMETLSNETDLTLKEKERYMLYHRRFAHLGPQRLKNLHLVTNLTRPIQVPQSNDERICEICLLTKMRNRTSKTLAKWKDTKLALIHFDVAGPFPQFLRGNK